MINDIIPPAITAPGLILARLKHRFLMRVAEAKRTVNRRA
ncbi:hypothetical protein BN134_4167 [Cronobacter dublinensis 1210]|uniref:Uncharacterized protein n=1 Tax=Cronobacter dublinensis 1210 TaxID=1208656 RepID=A0ABM9QCV4_9ENTR|nr:hypothetical protein BN134_4167 [Cronobacter dublinensis 1210]